MLGKPSFNDLREGIVTAPIMYGLLQYKNTGDEVKFNHLSKLINTEKTEANINEAAEILFQSNGISISDKLSINHIEEALQNLYRMRYNDGKPIVSFDQQHT